MATSTERITVKLPKGFKSEKHQRTIEKMIGEKHGDGFEIDSIESRGEGDDSYQVAIATRAVAIMEITQAKGSATKEVRLLRSVKPSDGDKQAVKLADQHGDGWEMTKFEPFLFKAVLTKLTPDEARCRGAISTALGVKPWDVQVKGRLDGGFDLELPKTYQPSKHDAKLEDVAVTVVGTEGWYVVADAKKLTASIIPSSPPTFPAMIPTPMGRVKKFDHTKADSFKIPLGMKLPAPGETVGETFYLDMAAGAHTQIGGISGGGKLQPAETRLPVPVSERFPSGWATNEELIVGDQLFSPDGSVVSVSGFSEWSTEPVYELVFGDGQVVEAGASHLWKVSSDTTRAAHSARERKSRAAHFEEFQQRAKEIREIAVGLPVGTVGSLLDISELAGFHRNAVTAMHLPIRHLATEAIMATAKPAQQFDVGVLKVSLKETPAVFRGEPLTADLLDGKGVAGWLTMREITSGILGRPSNRLERAGMSDLLRNRQVSGRMSTGSRMKKVYPADEVLGMIAARAEDQSYTSDSGRAVMDLEFVTDTRSMLEDFRHKSGAREATNYAVRLTQAVELPEADLLIDPYVMGAWLGDGSSWNSTITSSAGDSCTDASGLSDQDHMVSQISPHYEVNPSASKPAMVLNSRGLRADLMAVDVLRNKHIPAIYLRASEAQRLALLQGLMDTDGTISASGGCELALSDKRLAFDALELIRSLGIRVNTPLPEKAAYKDAEGNEVICKDRYRMRFTTTTQVFRLPRKAERVNQETRPTQQWNFIKEIRVVEPKRMRCIAVDHIEHLFLVEGFIPTHNTVLLNCYLATWLSRGAELAIIDLPTKSADFEWCKDFVRPGGWGCASPAQSAVAIRLIMDEGERRAKHIREHGVNDWKDLPESAALKPLIVIVDELTGLFALEAVPKAGKDAPQLLKDMAEDALRTNLFKEILKNGIKRVAAELRFTGVFLTLATQVASANTGIEPALRTNLHHKILMGAKPTEGNRRLVFSDPERVPLVPENIRSDGKAARGVGSSEPEGDEPAIFKSYFASVTQYQEWLNKLGVPKTNQPEPTRAQMAQLEDAFESDDREDTAARREKMPDPMAAAMGDSGLDENGHPLKGAALAAAQSRKLSNMAAASGGRA